MQHGRTVKRLEWLSPTFLIIVSTLLGVILWRVIFTNADIPTSSSSAEATAIANERLFQLAQWATSSVLTIGIALVGFNWVQNRREREELDEVVGHAKQVTDEVRRAHNDSLGELNSRQEKFETEVMARVELLEKFVAFSWDATMGQRLIDEATQETAPLPPTPSYFMRKFRLPSATFIEKRMNGQAVLFTMQKSMNNGALSSIDIADLHTFLPELLQFDSQLGMKLAELLTKAHGGKSS